MRVFVTGGAGFIGSWTVERLVQDGHEVCVFDSLVTGRPANLERVCREIQCANGDVRQPLALHRAVRRFKPEAIIHLAACVSVPLSMQRAVRSHDDNTRGTVAMLEAARANSVRRVVLASSAAVYGRNRNVPLAEDAALDPLSPYALHKRICEDYARLYTELYDLETVALRYFNVFGPRQDPNSPYSGVIARFADAARHGRSVFLTGDGSQTRDFVFVDDVARANVAATTRVLRGHHVINVATGRETSLLALRQTIEDVLGCPLPYTFAPARAGDVYRSCADVSRLRDLLNVVAGTSLADGLRALLG